MLCVWWYSIVAEKLHWPGEHSSALTNAADHPRLKSRNVVRYAVGEKNRALADVADHHMRNDNIPDGKSVPLKTNRDLTSHHYFSPIAFGIVFRRAGILRLLGIFN